MSESNELPFTSYPVAGQTFLGRCTGATCRRDYGLKFQRKTGQTCCAYCGDDLTQTYERWLTIAIDHVVPVSVGTRLCAPIEWVEDCINKVLTCTACNSFANRFRAEEVNECLTDLTGFIELRDKVFLARKALIAELHTDERAFFDLKPWRVAAK